METNSYVIESNALSKRFRRLEAVHSVGLNIPRGSVCALLGPNGAGKTTLLRMLVGLLEPTSGDATVMGRPIRKLGGKDFLKIGYVSENLQLPGWMTVRYFLDYQRTFYPNWDRDLEASLLKLFELPEDRKIEALSRGMAMKLQLLASTAFHPELLILDEPLGGLDPLARDDLIRGLLEGAGTEGWTVLISSHDISEIETLADHAAFLVGGRLVACDSIEALQAKAMRVEVTLPDDSSETFAPPTSARNIERSGRVIRYVDTEYDESFSGLANVAAEARPLSLRELFAFHARKQTATGVIQEVSR